MSNQHRHLTTGQVASYCSVTLRTVVNWVNKGILPAYKLPGTRGDNRIRSEDLIVFMRNNDLPIPAELMNEETTTLKALVVDDDPLMSQAIARVLRQLGLETIQANNGFTAGVGYAKEQPHLMTLDLMMPGLSGFELLKQIRKSSPVTGKILIISAAKDDFLRTAVQLGADAALSKPFDNAELRKKVTDLLSLPLIDV